MSAWSRTPAPQEPPQARELIIPQRSFESESEIPTIPDAEELTQISNENISKISKISLNQSTMYQELDSELLKQQAFVALDGVNLSPLLKFIHSDANVKEADAVWTIDSLFKDLTEYYKNEGVK